MLALRHTGICSRDLHPLSFRRLSEVNTPTFKLLCKLNECRTVSHGLEVLYVYGLLALIPGISPATLKLSSQMLHYWVSFATSLDPNDGKGEQRALTIFSVILYTCNFWYPGPTWPQYTPTEQVRLRFSYLPTLSYSSSCIETDRTARGQRACHSSMHLFQEQVSLLTLTASGQL